MLKTTLMALTGLLLAGCAATDLSKSNALHLEPDETLVLVAARVRNTREPAYPIVGFQPQFSRTPVAGGSAAVVRPMADSTFLIAKKIKSGDNEMTWLRGYTEFTPSLVRGSMYYGVSAPFTAKPGKIQYLGFLDIENVDRKSKDQQPTGTGRLWLPTQALLAQAVTGLGAGTLSVRLSDQSQRDIEQFKKTFPALANADIHSAPLQQITLEPRVIKPALKQGFEIPADPEVARLEPAYN